MGKVIAQASMSLDGFLADTNDEVDPLFDWSQNGDGEVTGGHPEFRTSAASAAYPAAGVVDHRCRRDRPASAVRQ